MGVQVSFNYVNWIQRYPEFATIDPSLINQYFTEATIFHRNDGGGPVRDTAQQTVLLNMVTAHICALNAPTSSGQPNPTLVGRISNASEGSVSVAADMDLPPGSAQWWNQTKYGAAYWVSSAPFRTFRYRVPWPRNFNPWPFQ
jgi:hypothetical protein